MCFATVQPALSSDLDDMLKKYPNPAAGTPDPIEITNRESQMLNGIRRHITKLYGLINTAARSRKLNDVQAATMQDKVGAIEDTITEMNNRPFYKYDGAQDGTQQLSYGDFATLVQMVGQTEAELSDLLAPKKPKNAPANAPAPAAAYDLPPPAAPVEVGPPHGQASSRLTYGRGPVTQQSTTAAAPNSSAAPTVGAPAKVTTPANVTDSVVFTGTTSRPALTEYQTRPVSKRFDETFKHQTSGQAPATSGSRFNQLFNSR